MIRSRRDGAVETITFTRPKSLNAFDAEGLVELRSLLQQTAVDPEVRAVLLTGEGRAFSAGGDVAVMKQAQEAGNLAHLFHVLTGEQEAAVREIVTMPKPVVAALPGVAAGGGMSLALACDWRIASSEASFVPAFPQLGAVPDGGLTYLLPHFLGIGLAQELLFAPATIGAERAREMGLVHEVVAADRLQHRSQERAAELAAGPTFAYGRMKRLMLSAFSSSLEAQMALERRAMVEAAQHHELPEGIRAFIEKRPPRFGPEPRGGSGRDPSP
jgi:2-(1,2-epoxy-1,2-dihydrophenyl)acetyl-CoA isomerase